MFSGRRIIAFYSNRELYPTSIRTTALASCSIMARFGAMSSPYVNLLGNYNAALPLTIYGLALLLAGIGSLWIWPDTQQVELAHMETIAECADLASTANPWVCQREKKDSLTNVKQPNNNDIVA